jgi:PPK2 family polyphosphate:nucleotide phosphotransferase
MGRSAVIDAVPDVEQSSYSDALGSDVTRIRIDADEHDLMFVGTAGVRECVLAEHFRWRGACFPGRADDREEIWMADMSKRIARFIEPFRVNPGSSVRLAKDFDPAFKAGVKKKKVGAQLLTDGIELLSEYQARLAAQDTYGVLVVLQALDAAGKDGTIRHVMSGVNPQGVRVESFRVPSARELDQDFLRRYQERLPSRGQIAIFNRSHYEEVLVVRVHPENLVRQKLPAETREHHVWTRRYEAINDWEMHLSRNGFRTVKIFLNLSKEEQRVRFLRRIDLPEHHWKFSSHDVEERRSWDAYQEAFSEMLSHTSTEWAPWYVIPADRKWFARIGAGAVIANALIDIDPQYPTLGEDALRDLQAAKVQLESEAPEGAAPDPFEEQETRAPVGSAAKTEG